MMLELGRKKVCSCKIGLVLESKHPFMEVFLPLMEGQASMHRSILLCDGSICSNDRGFMFHAWKIKCASMEAFHYIMEVFHYVMEEFVPTMEVKVCMHGSILLCDTSFSLCYGFILW